MHRLLCVLLPLAVVAADPTAKLKLAFSDEFDGAALDTTKWTYEGGSQAASLKGGKLVLTLIDRTDGWQGTAISTRDKFTQLHGYFEASIRFNAQRGHHGAFLVRNKTTTEPPAASLLFECFGEDRIIPAAQVADNTGLRMLKPIKHGIEFDGGASYKKFHTYGVLWTPKYFEWYVDGKKVHRLEQKAVPTTPMYVEFCHHTAEGGKVKDFMDPTNGPEPLQVDWVKVWK